MQLTEVPTPAAVVDHDRLRGSCQAMRALAERHGVRLRPHVKTHKCVEVALQQCAGAGPVTVSTLAEARRFAEAGFADILWAVPCPHPRVGEVAELVASGLRLSVLADHVDTVAALSTAAAHRGLALDVMLKVDSGAGRAGVSPEGDAAVDVARAIVDAAGLNLAGLLTHAGQAYAGRSREDAAAVAVAECAAVERLAHRLRERGIDPGTLSVGSTPTVRAWDAAFSPPGSAGVDEIRPGNYVYFDRFQVAVGSCSLDEVAFTVVASIIGRYTERQTAVLDAGALALSVDPGPIHVDPKCGYGQLLDLAGEPLPGLVLRRLSQEHGVVHAVAPGALDRLKVGQRVRIVPNHSCLTAALHGRYLVAEGDAIVAEWHPARGW